MKLRICLAIALLLLFSSTAYALTTTTNGNGTDWNTANNWDVQVPTVDDDAVVNHPMSINGTGATFNTLDNNDTITFTANCTVTIKDGGSVDNAGGTVDMGTNDNDITWTASTGASHWTWTISSGTITWSTGTTTWNWGTWTTAALASINPAGTFNFDENFTFFESGTNIEYRFGNGITVNFAAGKTYIIGSGTFYCNLTFAKEVNAIGSSGNEITFDGGAKKGQWGMNPQTGAGGINLQYCNFTDMQNGPLLTGINQTGGDTFTMDNCNMYSSNLGQYIQAVTGTITISNSNYYSNSTSGVQVVAASGTVNFDDCSFYSNSVYNVYVTGNANVQLRRFKNYAASFNGIHSVGTNLGMESGLSYENTRDNCQPYRTEAKAIVNCTFADPGAAYSNIQVDLDAGDSLAITNVILSGGKYGINSVSGVGDPDPVVTYTDCTGGTTADYNGMTDPTGTNGNIDADPKFTSAATDDYHIGGGSSPCINTGTSTGAPANDIDDVAWPNANPEMGCYGEAESAAEYATAIFFGSHF